jgi:hypothetical protein
MLKLLKPRPLLEGHVADMHWSILKLLKPRPLLEGHVADMHWSMLKQLKTCSSYKSQF